MSANVKALLHAVREADRALEKGLRADYPVGALIRWSRAGREQFGYVVRNGYRDRIEVENGRTLRHLWIRAYDIL